MEVSFTAREVKDMPRENQMELVRRLTQTVMETVRPEAMSTFGEDFGHFALRAGLLQAEESLAQSRPQEEVLETTLVAGMFFRILMEAENLPASTQERVSFMRRQAKNYLATKLAGQITLPQFFRLLSLIEENVQRYFQQAREHWLGSPEPSPPRPLSQVQKGEEDPMALRRALKEAPLTPKGRRKLTISSLEQFLLNTGGEWFRLLDFEEHFRVNKKTAWAYLHQLVQAGILVHNGEKANKVRYALASRFCR